MSEPTTLSGAQLGPYQVRVLLGAGGMGEVYEAFDYQLKRDVALKVLNAVYSADGASRRRFEREMELLIQLEHPNVVPVYDVGLEDGRLYIAMRLIRGPDLGALIRDERLERSRALELLEDVSEALAFMHGRGVVHRDVKPQNIFVAEAGTAGEYAVLGDLGIARVIDGTTQLTGVGWIGTPGYMAPELFLGDAASPQSDVYSLGCVAYELLAGVAAFPEGSDPALRQTGPDMTPIGTSAGAVLSKAMAPAPAERQADPRAFMKALKEALSVGGGTSAEQAAPPSFARLEDAAEYLLEVRGSWLTADEIADSINEMGMFRRPVSALEISNRLRNRQIRFRRDKNRFRLWPNARRTG